MQKARDPKPSKQETLLSGRVLVPPKFLEECRIMMFLLASAAKITVSISSASDHSFSAFEDPELRLSPNAWRFLLPASLLSCLLNQSDQVSDQVVCFGMMFLILLKLLSIFLSWGLSFDPLRMEKRGGNETSQFHLVSLQTFQYLAEFEIFFC
jgi:hypothetical protein